jgi:hypothetical protein
MQGLSCSSVPEMTAKALEELLYVEVGIRKPAHVMPSWQAIHILMSSCASTINLARSSSLTRGTNDSHP